MKNEVLLIGDVHGKYDRYHKIIRQTDRYPYTIQLGDFGFNYDTLKNVDPNNHKILGGNHDNYSIVNNFPHFLGDYGNFSLNGIDFFYYRGAWSIDRIYRTEGLDWWPQEQNNIDAFLKARELYRETKPDIVLTHDCPLDIIHYLLPLGSKIYENNTTWVLQEFFNIHQPKIWRFGHYHISWEMNVGQTNFKCLNELEIELLKIEPKG
jgi:predicted phosphodiesterase